MAAGVTVPVKENEEQAGWKLSVTKPDVAASLDQRGCRDRMSLFDQAKVIRNVL